jgi:energy-coupling factor transporter ATP-binding protein EcfA2
MLTVLLGPNFSGRSNWLAARRKHASWPDIAFLGPLADTTTTGLAWTLREELRVAGMGRPSNGAPPGTEVVAKLALERLLDQELYTLSGGEAVRGALASVVAQQVTELHIDSALEQLDAQWRPQIISLLLRGTNDVAERVFLSDNHLTQDERRRFKNVLPFATPKMSLLDSAINIQPTEAGREILPVDPLEIKTHEVWFRYPHTSEYIFEDVSVVLKPGRLHFLLGPNGSGKTTFVKLLSGTILPRRGELTFGLKKFNPRKGRERFMAVAFQNPDYQWTSLSVVSEIRRAAWRPRVPELVPAVLLPFGIASKWAQCNPIELPFVVKKRLGIALAMLAGAPWIVLDEPTIGQDFAFRNGLAQLVHIVLAKGVGVLIVSHDTYFRALFPEAIHLRFQGKKINID